MRLGQKQRLFARLLPRLIDYAHAMGYEVTFGETYRTREQASLNAERGTGIANSLHTQRLAIDLNLFLDGKYLRKTEDYRLIGEYWEGLHELCRWGGRFKRKDGGHFSLTHGGRA